MGLDWQWQALDLNYVHASGALYRGYNQYTVVDRFYRGGRIHSA